MVHAGKRAAISDVLQKVDFVGQPYEGACYYRITRCPVCAYAEKLGVSELIPLFCELDEVMIALQHGVLHRTQTIAGGGDCCDYFITGDKAQASGCACFLEECLRCKTIGSGVKFAR